MRTLQALREAVYSALTTPPLQYQIDTTSAPLQTLPAASVHAKAVWDAGDPPMPALAFSVSAAGNPSRLEAERTLTLRVWAISASTGDECTEIYEAARARLHTADQDAPPGIADLSRPSVGGALGLVVRELIEQRVSEASFDQQTSKWYVTAEYRVIAL